MAQKTEVVAMLLAGGQGSRLGVLTKNIAKPAVPYGGNYRIIDFPLSNCVNSGIYTVGVLTQYQPLELNDYLGNGQPWDLDRQNGGIHILSPYEAIGGAEWYKGTANAIYQNINFIEKYDPEYVVILSGDHIYKMNYAKMVDFHKKNNADCTIAVLEVPWEEASRFGILATNDDDRIYEFAEKPTSLSILLRPKSRKSQKATRLQWAFTFSVGISSRNILFRMKTQRVRLTTSVKILFLQCLRQAKDFLPFLLRDIGKMSEQLTLFGRQTLILSILMLTLI